MKNGFYPKLAFSSMRKNKSFYLPYILTCVGMVMMEYIINFLSVTPVFSNMPGAASLQAMLGMGSWIIIIFSVIFLFYTNSFLMRRRRKEFGLYNILGMDKFNIGRVLFWETAITAAVSLVVGLGLGVVLSKLAELSLVNVMKGQVTYTISVSTESLVDTAIAFLVIFALLLVYSLIRIKISDPITMLRSDSYGERQPKGNWFIAILGAAALAWAYYMAVTISDPLSALIWFFAAVVMVIIGTYLLFISGSVVMCRLLQKNKKYYYKANHFVSVSSMAYRMKRNGAGLASICILGTMVLVMIASTSCLYFGASDALSSRYPRDINAEVNFADIDSMTESNIETLRGKAEEIIADNNADETDILDYRYAAFTGLVSEDGTVDLDIEAYSSFNAGSYDNLYVYYIMPLEDYNKMTGQSETLETGEAMIYVNRGGYDNESIVFEDGTTIHVSKVLDEFIANPNAAVDVTPAVFVVTDDFEKIAASLKGVSSYNTFCWNYSFNTSISEAQQTDLKNQLYEEYKSLGAEDGGFSAYCESLAENRDDFYGTFGGLFFLGIMLSIVFIFAAVLIIYYKQISEGYEDQSRFDIMQKVGMTKKDIRKSINSQLLTVFFLPLCMAGIHLAFAFPLLQKMLMLFNLINIKLLILTTAISFLVFALFYVVVYRITSNAYYKIVAGRK